MYDAIHTSTILDQHRATAVTREVEHLRRQAERRAVQGATEHPTGFAVVTEWFGKTIHVHHALKHAAPPRIAANH